MSCRCITGVVVKEGTTDPQPGLRVELTTGKGRSKVRLAETRTDAHGRFSFSLERLNDKGSWTGVFQLAVFAKTLPLIATGDVRFSARRDARNLVVCVEWPARCAAPEVALIAATDGVHGQATHMDGTHLAGLHAALFKVEFSGVTQVGTTQTTEDDGSFAFGSISAGDYYVVLKKPVDGDPTHDVPIATSKVKYGHTSGAHRFAISVCEDGHRGPSEFARITKELAHEIDPTDTTPPYEAMIAGLLALDVRQALYLAGKTDWTLDLVVTRALAEKIADEMNGTSPTIPVLPEGIYGLLRQGFPKTTLGILTRAPSAVGRAITLSRKANIIAHTFALDTFRDGLKEALGRALADPDSLDSLGAILATSYALSLPSGLDPSQVEAFCRLYAGYTGTDEAFWADVADLGEFSDPDDVDEARRLVVLGTIAVGSAACVSAILDAAAGGLGVQAASVTAGWDATTWTAVATAVSTAGDMPSGLDEADPIADLARILQENAHLAFPSEALTAAMLGAAGGELGVDGVLALSANAGLDLRTKRLHAGSFTSTNPSDAAVVATELNALRTAQRLCRVAPRVDAGAAMQRLNDAGISSARDVMRRGSSRFIATYTASDASLEDEAVEIVAKARSQHGMAVAFFGQAAPTLGLASLGFVGTDEITVTDDDVPGWSSLFTSPTGTRCGWCQSVHGPSAYLVDLLHWLAAKTDPTLATTDTVLTKLSARRPDITQIPLTCENAERVLPYIDLTLECLEAAVSGGIGTNVYSSESETPELLAAPQYTNTAAYDTLAADTSSFALPFHQPLAEARPFLAHLGIERTDLMRAYQASGTPSNVDIAFEELRLVKPASGNDAITDNSGSSPVAATEQGYWPAEFVLSPSVDVPTVATFLRGTGLDYAETLDLLHTRAANPDTGLHELVVLQTSGADPYAWSSYVIEQVTAVDGTTGAPTTYGAPSIGQFAALRKMIRLRRATGWTFLALDKVVAALGAQSPASWSTTTLEDVANVHRLERLTELDPVELAAWFGTIDTYQDRDTADHPVLSLYDQTFLNPSVFPKIDVDAVDATPNHTFPFVLNGGRTEVYTGDLPSGTSKLLADHAGRLRAALGVDESEVGGLIGALDELDALGTVVDTVDLAAPGLTLANLTRLYRWCSVGRVLGVKPTEALRFAVLLGMAPSYTSSIQEGFFASRTDTIEFLQQVRECQAAGWSIDELDYMVRHANADRVAPTDDFFKGVLGRLHDAVAAQSSDDSDATRVDAIIRQLAAEFRVDRATLDALNSSMHTGAPPASSSDFFTGFVAADMTFSSVAETTSSTTITLTADATVGAATVPSGTDITFAAGIPLVAPAGVASAAAGTRCAYDAGDLLIEQTALAASTVTISGATVTYDLGGGPVTGSLVGSASGTLTAGATFAARASSVVASDLFSRFLRSGFTAAISAVDNDPWASVSRSGAFHDDFAILDGVFKALLLQSKLGANEDERAAWVARNGDTSWDLLDPAILWGADLAGILTTGSDGYTRLKHTIDLFAARARLPGAAPSFADILASLATDAAAAVVDIAARTGWDTALLGEVLGSAPTSTDALTLVLDKLDIARRAGALASVVAGWAGAGSTTGFTATESREIVAAARSRYATPAAWSSVARPIRDPVRKAQRDALVAWHIANPNGQVFDDAEDVYQYFLIDVSMNPEMLTSRIVQASCTVQLFIHRCLFGLEADSLGDWFNDEDRTEWEWMRTYRIWEAARKVFLYPENWIEPELRDDKTPLFTALERELSQGDVTSDRVEQVALDYLDRLHDVASLQVLACYVQKESDADGDIDYLHVFARSHASPPVYWYRRREDSATWTAWERIDAGVQGDHLVPVVYNRRLMLFWGEFLATNTEVQYADPSTWWEIRLAMSEYRDGKWSAKQMSKDALSLQSDWFTAHQAESSYGFTASVDAEDVLTVSCYFVANTGATALQYAQVGTFTIEPCTMQIEATAAVTSTSRIALDPPYWEAPGFATPQEIGDTERTNSLDIYLGDADSETGDAVGSATAVSVLAGPGDAIVVVPSQWSDFVSQSPFFVAIGQRTYFVEPQLPDDGDLSDTASSSTPSIAGIGGFRKGTTSSPAGDSTGLTGGQDSTTYPSGDEYRSDSEAEDAATSAAIALAGIGDSPLAVGTLGTYRFTNFYHPFVCAFVKQLRRDGIFGLLDPDPTGTASELFRQAVTGDASKSFENSYGPTSRVDTDYPVEDVDFDVDGAYSQYNWEIFFHLPYYVANRLADQGRFQEAFDYFHCIFDPRTRTAPTASGIEGAVDTAQWWKVKPFLTAVSTPVTDWIAFTGTTDTSGQASFESQVAAWRADPFNPHLLARMRPGTYQRALVMRYIETLIAWGDELFTRDTIESLNEATQLYVFAKQVLGDKPALLGDTTKPTPQSYADLSASGTLDDFSNATVAIENAGFSGSGVGTDDAGNAVTATIGATGYFCVPFNMKLIAYWDLVDDRLFKIRNGMNISGVHRSLPLFQPPIDPAMLVRAAAAGIDIGSVFDSDGDAGNYRFSTMLGRAQALAGSLKALGQALLGALEKRDGEALALLRQQHEGALFDAMKGVKERAVEEAKENLAAARKTKHMTEARHNYYTKLIDVGWLSTEHASADLIDGALVLDNLAGSMSTLASVLALIPDIGAGIALHARFGGSNLRNAAEATAGTVNTLSGVAKTLSGRLSTTATYKRREQDWKQQKKLAAKELELNDKQIVAAEIRLDVAKRELRNQELQIKQSAEINDWMQRKWTNQELYDWTASSLAALHFQTYQLALSTATKAQACYRKEIGDDNASFIGAVYWDSGKKGLLAGERLAADLDRMDAAYLDNDNREFELTKHVALSKLDPFALQRLRVDGECYFVIPEVAFELDAPGHWMRRIQSVALSIAAVTGQQGTVNAQLTLHQSYTRTSASDSGAAELAVESDTPSIVTSVATQDAGLFQADLKDPRYLPFERRGAVSAWHLKLTARTIKQIAWDSITDVVLHMRYTARDNGSTPTASLTDLLMGYDSGFAATDLDDTASGMQGGAVFVVSAKRDDPDTLYAAQQAGSHDIAITVTASMLGTLATGRTLARVLLLPSAALTTPAVNGAATTSGTFATTTQHYYLATPSGSLASTPAQTYTISTGASLASLDDLILVLVLT